MRDDRDPLALKITSAGVTGMCEPFLTTLLTRDPAKSAY